MQQNLNHKERKEDTKNTKIIVKRCENLGRTSVQQKLNHEGREGGAKDRKEIKKLLNFLRSFSIMLVRLDQNLKEWAVVQNL